MFEIDQKARRLSDEEKEQYMKKGYTTGLPVFSENAVNDLHNWYDELSSKLPPDIDINKTNMWHKASKKFHDLCRTPAILDYVEDLLGPNFVQWGGQFFSKEPKDGSVVPWHQDAQYWPLNPSNAVTVWLAVFDTDEENGAMQFLPGSHKVGHIPWKESSEASVLNQQIKDISMFDKPFSNNLKAGEYSLHSSLLVHGSPKNQSSRRRCGLTIRYAPQDVVPLSPNYSEMSYFVSGDITAPHWQDNLPPSKYFL